MIFLQLQAQDGVAIKWMAWVTKKWDKSIVNEKHELLNRFTLPGRNCTALLLLMVRVAKSAGFGAVLAHINEVLAHGT